jgi:capsular polysaccharide transport system permease protein
MLHKPEPGSGLDLLGTVERLQHRVSTRTRLGPFALFVLLPTLLVGAYLFLFSANQYVSEAQFQVRGGAPSAPAGLGQLLGNLTSDGNSESANSVKVYMLSRDAVQDLSREIDLDAMFHKPLLDVVGRLWGNPTAEQRLKYFRRHVDVSVDSETGISTLQVRAFSPADSAQIAGRLLNGAERLVNRLNRRAEDDTLSLANRQVREAEARVNLTQAQLTAFRNSQGSVDPTKSSALVMTVAGELEGKLAQARAELAAQSHYLTPDSAALKLLRAKVQALESQVQAQNSRLTGGRGSLAPSLSRYEQLSLDKEFAEKEYASALAAQQTALIDSQKQHSYLVRIVEPRPAEESTYPKRWLTLLSSFVLLTLAYGVGWLVIAGIKEHVS